MEKIAARQVAGKPALKLRRRAHRLQLRRGRRRFGDPDGQHIHAQRKADHQHGGMRAEQKQTSHKLHAMNLPQGTRQMNFLTAMVASFFRHEHSVRRTIGGG